MHAAFLHILTYGNIKEKCFCYYYWNKILKTSDLLHKRVLLRMEEASVIDLLVIFMLSRYVCAVTLL